MYSILKLQPGANPMRILTLPYRYTTHIESSEGQPLDTLASCIVFYGNCKECEAGNKPKTRWFLGILDRRSDEFRLLDVNAQMFRQIQVFAQHPQWGDPIAYDIEISKESGYSQEQYIIALPKSPLSQRELDITSKVNTKFLEDICTPKKVEDGDIRL